MCLPFSPVLTYDSIEKQLSTAWVLKLLQDFLKTSDLARMGELKHIKLPTERSKAKIFLNHNPCGRSVDFHN